MTHSRGTFCTAEDKVQAYGLEWIEHLISLLEEKDKALAFYADEKNHDWKLNEYRNVEPTKVMLDGGEIARNALLTSSNNEGENK
jgi:hypothetical protein